MRKRTYSMNYDPIDEFMEKNNLYRKQLPRDGTCLFRAAAEQFLYCQNLHIDIRNLCINYMLLYKDCFQTVMTENVEDHVEKMMNPLNHGGLPELMAISQIFKCDYVIYSDLTIEHYMNHYKSKKPLLLYMDQSNHFDLLYPKKHSNKAGFCQAVIYEILYTNVLKMEDVMDVVDQMLHNTNSSYRTDSCNSNDIKDIMFMVDQTLKMDINKNKVEENSVALDTENSPPFPYRVAKALDPDIYRNIEYDAWKVLKREAKYGPYDKKGLQIGVKVVIKLNLVDKSTGFADIHKSKNSNSPFVKDTINGYIQSMSEDQGPVTVYAEEYGKIIQVPYNALEKVAVNSAIYSPQEFKGYANVNPYKRLTSSSSWCKDGVSNPPLAKVNKSFELPQPVSTMEPKINKTDDDEEEENKMSNTKGSIEDVFIENDGNNPYIANTSLCMYGGYNEPLCMPCGSVGTAPVIYNPNDGMMGPTCYGYPQSYLCQPEAYPSNSFYNYPMYGQYQPYPYYVYYGSPYYNDYPPPTNCYPGYGEVPFPEFSTENYNGWDEAQFELDEGYVQTHCSEVRKRGGEYVSSNNLEGKQLITL